VGTTILPKVKSSTDLAPRLSTPYVVDSHQAASAAADAAETKKGSGTIILDVRQITLLADFFVITGGDSANQIKAIVEAIDQKMSELGYPARSIEGKTEGRWVLLDYGDIIVHVLQERERSYYKLEQFWNTALKVDRKAI
jgi:ribosome-associated protein